MQSCQIYRYMDALLGPKGNFPLKQLGIFSPDVFITSTPFCMYNVYVFRLIRLVATVMWCHHCEKFDISCWFILNHDVYHPIPTTFHVSAIHRFWNVKRRPMIGGGVSGRPPHLFSPVLTTPPSLALYALLAVPARCQSHTGGSQPRG